MEIYNMKNVIIHEDNNIYYVSISPIYTTFIQPFGEITWQTDGNHYLIDNKEYINLLKSEDQIVVDMIHAILQNSEIKDIIFYKQKQYKYII